MKQSIIQFDLEFEETVLSALRAFRPEIDVSRFVAPVADGGAGWTVDETSERYEAVLWHHPEIFYVNKVRTFDWTKLPDGRLVRVRIHGMPYAIGADEYAARADELESSVASALATLGSGDRRASAFGTHATLGSGDRRASAFGTHATLGSGDRRASAFGTHATLGNGEGRAAAEDDAERARRLHDFLLAHCQFDKRGMEGSSSSGTSSSTSSASTSSSTSSASTSSASTSSAYRTSYDALVRGRAVCEGYTMGYALLLARAGIESKVAVSAAMNHCWNVVKIGGEWRHVDVTRDDPTYEVRLRLRERLASHRYFLVTDRALAAKGHRDWKIV